jgi:hypothetical protein
MRKKVLDEIAVEGKGTFNLMVFWQPLSCFIVRVVFPKRATSL